MPKSLVVTAMLLAMLGCGAGVIDGPPGTEPNVEVPSGDPSASPRGIATTQAAAPSTASPGPSSSGDGSASAAPTASTPPAAPDSPPTTAPDYVPHQVTFYGWPDNTPAGAAIAYPNVHTKAGGVGTFDDPLTFATDIREWPAGTLLYVPLIEKYVVMEDSCSRCRTDWTSGVAHIDIWMNSGASFSSALLACEKTWTRDDLEIEIHPPKGRPVSTAPLFDPSTGVCRKP